MGCIHCFNKEKEKISHIVPNSEVPKQSGPSLLKDNLILRALITAARRVWYSEKLMNFFEKNKKIKNK